MYKLVSEQYNKKEFSNQISFPEKYHTISSLNYNKYIIKLYHVYYTLLMFYALKCFTHDRDH